MHDYRLGSYVIKQYLPVIFRAHCNFNDTLFKCCSD